MVTSWLLLCTRDSILHSHIVFTEYPGNQKQTKRSIMHFIKQQQKYNAFTGADILIIYIPKKDGVYYLILRNYLCLLHCVYYIQLDNRDLQSCQVDQGKDVAIIAISKSTLCTLGHQAVPRLVSGLDLMWHTSTREVLIGEELFDFCCLGSDC